MKTSQIEKAVAALEAERAILDLAIAKLKAQMDQKPKIVRTRKVKAESEAKAV